MVAVSMKKLFSNILLVALFAAMALCCQKPEVAMTGPDVDVVSLTFASEKPVFDDETKTEWTGEGVRWSAGDKIAVAYTVNGKWQNASGNASGNAKLYKSSALTSAAEKAQFNVSASFSGTTSGTHVFYGVYPAPESTDFSGAPYAVLTIPATQTPAADSFDATGDLMVGVSGEYPSRPASGEKISLVWKRQVAHANITLKSIKGFAAGEKVKTITLTAQSGANLVGQQKVNLLDGAVTRVNSSSNVITVAGDNLSADNSGNVSFWACILPAKVTSLKVEVITDKATYTRDISSCNLEFKKNARNVLGIRMDGATRVGFPVMVERSLSFADKADRISYSTSQQVWSQNGITLTNDKASSSSNVGDYSNPARFYAGSSLRVEAGGNDMYKIVFNCSSSSYASQLHSSIGTVSGADVEDSGTYVTVSFKSPVTSFSVAQLAAQVRMNSISVTYLTDGSSDVGGGGDQPTPEPEPEPEPDPEPDPTPDVPSGTVNPALNHKWLELPADTGNEEYVLTFFDGKARNYSYNYDVDTFSSLWVAYPLYSATTGGTRDGSWKKNESIPTENQINVWTSSYGVNVGKTDSSGYTTSSNYYARGHQIPDADRSGNATMQQQTYFVTNSTPQIQNSFNGGIWMNLENAVRDVASGTDTLYVVTGPTYKKVGGTEDVTWILPKNEIDKRCPLPNYYWKVLLKVKRNASNVVTSASTIGFWFEHKTYSGSYTNYAVSVDQIEQWTGFDFFVNLPDAIEVAVEKNTSWTTFQQF